MRRPLSSSEACTARRTCGRRLVGIWILLLISLVSQTNSYVLWNGGVTNGFISSRLGPRRDGRRMLSALAEQNGESANDAKSKPEFSIRKAMYSDLGIVSDLIMTSFYTGENARSPWRQMFRLGELNRLQQNFPYDDDKHSMLVASCRSTHEIIAFVDVDARPAKRLQDPPRPYLSDLSVDPDWRRNGIASHLIQECERLAVKMGKNELYIRVERNNTPALAMYQGLGYEAQPHDYFGVVDTTILLNKKLCVIDRNCTGDDIVLDYRL